MYVESCFCSGGDFRLLFAAANCFVTQGPALLFSAGRSAGLLPTLPLPLPMFCSSLCICAPRTAVSATKADSGPLAAQSSLARVVRGAAAGDGRSRRFFAMPRRDSITDDGPKTGRRSRSWAWCGPVADALSSGTGPCPASGLLAAAVRGGVRGRRISPRWCRRVQKRHKGGSGSVGREDRLVSVA